MQHLLCEGCAHLQYSRFQRFIQYPFTPIRRHHLQCYATPGKPLPQVQVCTFPQFMHSPQALAPVMVAALHVRQGKCPELSSAVACAAACLHHLVPLWRPARSCHELSGNAPDEAEITIICKICVKKGDLQLAVKHCKFSKVN